MFCTECGQVMADEAKFCAFCGTRRVVIPSAAEVVAPPPPPVRSEVPAAPPEPPARTIHSTAEIMPVRVQRPPAPPPPPPIEPLPVQREVAKQVESTAPWPAEESAPQFAVPEPKFSRPEPSRPSASAPLEYSVAPPAAVANPAVRYAAVPFAATPGAHDVEGERKKVSPVLIGAIAIALIAVAGIVWMLRSSMSLGGKVPTNVQITIYPTAAKVAQGKGIDFVSEVSGAPSGEVTWSVEEGDSAGTILSRGASAKADTISLYCTYTAPQKPGTYHLVATSTVDKSKSATAEITVTGTGK